ncbi:hypothetical protein EDD85DRAFT_956404 [Armillaria nabsnona]|nr:hypothetical protein EDD85DRAFT_956404 [Armillaria nabsnona]
MVLPSGAGHPQDGCTVPALLLRVAQKSLPRFCSPPVRSMSTHFTNLRKSIVSSNVPLPDTFDEPLESSHSVSSHVFLVSLVTITHLIAVVSVSPPVPSASLIPLVAHAVLPATPPPLAPTDTVLPLPTARAITTITAVTECVARLPPPIQVIWSLTVMDTTDANTLQMDAAQQTLPQHQNASQTIPPSANTKGKHKAHLASINPQKSHIKVDIMIAPNIGEPDNVVIRLVSGYP